MITEGLQVGLLLCRNGFAPYLCGQVICSLEEVKHLVKKNLEVLVLRKMIGYLIRLAVGFEVTLDADFPLVALIAFGQCLEEREPVLISLLRVACLAAREEVSDSMTIPTEFPISHDSMNMIPCFCLATAIGAVQVGIWVLSERSYGTAHPLLVKHVEWSDGRGERVSDGSFPILLN